MVKLILIFLLMFTSCNEISKKIHEEHKKFERIKTSQYELIKVDNQKGLLILFPCFSCDAENTLSEFNIAEISKEFDFSILAMNFNQRLFLSKKEKHELSEQLKNIIQEQNLTNQNIFIGGFSSGGNISLLISDYLIGHNSQIQPKGIFIVDSPVDLLGLYRTAEKNLSLNFSIQFVTESKWIHQMLKNTLGDPNNGINNYELNSPYTLESQNIENLKNLRDLKFRLYTEPDLEWWNEYSNNVFEDLNSFYIQNLAKRLKTEFRSENIELIKTKNRGYRRNGERHPHSWSIVDKRDLMDWMLN